VTLIGDVQRVAALIYVSMQRDTNTALGETIGRKVFEHLVERELIYSPHGWPIWDYLVTIEGRQELERLLGGGNEKSSSKRKRAAVGARQDDDTARNRSATDPTQDRGVQPATEVDMEVKPPTSIDEYNKRFMANMEVSGQGIEGVTQHMPCPFCAAKDWLVVRVIDFGAEHEETCDECGRTAKITFTDDGRSRTMSTVQTGGPDQPEWLPAMPDVRHA
jgi:hypothetical protein